MGLTRQRWEVDGLMQNIGQTGDRAIKHGIEVIRAEGEEMAKLAREYAPVDEGMLEEAIVSRDGERDSSRRKTVEVGVDPIAPGSGGKPFAEDYALKMHELQVPYGTGAIGLGPRSAAKDAGRGVVGGKFLERAISERIGIVKEKLARMWAAQFGSRK